MDTDKRSKIAELAERAERANIAFDALRKATAPTDVEERIKHRVQVELARAELYESHELLSSAITAPRFT